jgi:hypothetical protein
MPTTGIICDNTCLGFSPGDDSFDFKFGPDFGNLAGKPFSLVDSGVDYALTINGVTQHVPYSEITAADPTLGYASGTLQFYEVLVNNPYGVAFEQQYMCIPTAVPEPATWLLMLIGFAMVAKFARKLAHG